MAKLIKTWEELAQVPSSETHRLEINDCNGWIVTKHPKSDKFSDRQQYLSTHTFYGGRYKHSTKLLQSCGFDIEIDNWDKEE
ncbi:hypothetical protein NVP1231O_06 [Vibrio phage 1.231.O._10N.261.49.F8]|nr:hypothetical protein NVP1119O_06 [Vibrio phage 1.119.O._10N.261.51.A9]AUR90378.1 hypothetical protein NVP1143O_06 [Vibrio phage 1.143.O._10N.261.55.C8]AUR96664.1 hypothetical protein NVP1231O_06 [Vibrio phage 1.231.O._10N.261.49.F8]